MAIVTARHSIETTCRTVVSKTRDISLLPEASAEETNPDVTKHRTVGALAVASKVLSHDGRDGHGDTDEAVVVDADPDDIEPREAALGRAPGATLAAAAGAEPIDGPDPGLDGPHVAEEVLLLVQVGRDVVAHEGEERGDGEGLVAIADDLEVHGMVIVPQLKERRRGVDGNHEQDSYDAVPRLVSSV